MRRFYRVYKWAAAIVLLLYALVVLLRRFFDIAFIYSSGYYILAGLTLAGFCLMFFCGRRYVLSSLCAAVLILSAGFLCFISIYFSAFKQDVKIYYGTTDAGRKVYFDTTGNFFMSDKQYHYVEEADVWLGVFYRNKRLVEGFYPAP